MPNYINSHLNLPIQYTYRTCEVINRVACIPDNRMVWVWSERGRGCVTLKILDFDIEKLKEHRRWTD